MKAIILYASKNIKRSKRVLLFLTFFIFSLTQNTVPYNINNNTYTFFIFKNFQITEHFATFPNLSSKSIAMISPRVNMSVNVLKNLISTDSFLNPAEPSKYKYNHRININAYVTTYSYTRLLTKSKETDCNL